MVGEKLKNFGGRAKVSTRFLKEVEIVQKIGNRDPKRVMVKTEYTNIFASRFLMCIMMTPK